MKNNKDDTELTQEYQSSFIIQDTDANNPYGPNYTLLPIDTKVYYKWLRLKKFIHQMPEDQHEHLRQNYKFYGSCTFTGIVMFGFAYGTKNTMMIKHTPKLYDLINEMKF